MAIEQYALCPCGSGKKIKFCKCADSVGELDRIMKMVSGDQVVAALDRLNHVLKEHPDAAWALAVKGRLLISLNETKSLMENAERFIRLQPSNPLALAQQSIAYFFAMDLKASADCLLKALAESGTAIDEFLLEAASLLSYGLCETGNFLSARLYATLPLSTGQIDDEAQIGMKVLTQLNQDFRINLLLKHLPPSLPRPENVAWGERYDEAMSLILSQQILAAEAKLEALDRQFPGQAAIISGLVTCSLWKADLSLQVRLFRKLSNAITDNDELAARFRALALLNDDDNKELAVEVHNLTCDLPNTDEVLAAIMADPQCHEAQISRDMAPESAVPPKGIFTISRSPRDFGLAEDAPVRFIAGLMFVYGRQTDCPPQAKILSVTAADRSHVEEVVRRILNAEPSFTTETHAVSLTQMVIPRMESTSPESQEQHEAFVKEKIPQLATELALKMPLREPEGKTLGELAEDPATVVLRTAFIRCLEGDSRLNGSFLALWAKLAEGLKVSLLQPIEITDEDDVETLAPIELGLIDPAGLTAEGLTFLYQRARFCLNQKALERTSERLISLKPEDLVHEDFDVEAGKNLILSAWMFRMQNARAESELEQISLQIQAWCKENGVSDAPVLLQEMQMAYFMGLPHRMRAALDQIATKHGGNAEVMQMVQRFLVQVGILNPDGSARHYPAAPANPSLAVDTMGAGAAPQIVSSSGQAPASGSGSGKLWIPGMD